ncbi:MAG: YIP1 family protein [Ignavibacteriales bacterium]|nr:YIP1 family protein [Ignavibacteriales bacterium]
MEEMQNQEAPKMSSVEQEEFEMSHTDKLVGVFSEPDATFSKMSKFPPKTADWVIPILIVIVITILSQFLMMNNPTIKAALVEKQMAAVEKSFNDAVAKGQMTQAQADQRLESTRDQLGQSGGAIRMISVFVGIPFGVFLYFFIVSGVYLILAKFVLKGTGTYKEAMVAYGLPHYILAIQAIVMVIAALAMNKLFTGTSVADFIGTEKNTIAGFILGKLDVFSIWFYVVFGVALAKMFKSSNTLKYIIGIVAVWLGFGLLFFALAKSVPFLSFLAG